MWPPAVTVDIIFSATRGKVLRPEGCVLSFLREIGIMRPSLKLCGFCSISDESGFVRSIWYVFWEFGGSGFNAEAQRIRDAESRGERHVALRTSDTFLTGNCQQTDQRNCSPPPFALR